MTHPTPKGPGPGLMLFSLLAALSLSACTIIGPPPDQGESGASSRRTQSSEAAFVKREDSLPENLTLGHSSYGRGSLTPELQSAYDQLVQGMLRRETDISLSLGDEESLAQALLCVRRDYPILSWIENQYSYQVNSNKIIQSVSLNYSKSADTIQAETEAIYQAGLEFTANLDPGFSDFDKALILYDRLCEAVEYDLEAPNQRELYGALVDQRATCDGYSKAYQYLLSLAGLEALIVYGEAEEPHAWNIVRLDGSYYLADPTWGDAALNDGGIFLSHEFLFLDDKSFSRSHTPYGEEHNYTLPACVSMEQNYFIKMGTMLSGTAEGEFETCLQNALDLALANNYDALQIRFLTPEVGADSQSRWIDTGDADQLIRKLARNRDKAPIGRSLSNYDDVLTYLLE